MPTKGSTPSKEQTAQAIQQIHASFSAFAKVMRRGRIEFALPHRKLIETLEGIESGKHDRVQVLMPPRNGKSLLSSELFPAWYLGKHPDRSVIASSYGQELASDFGRRVR